MKSNHFSPKKKFFKTEGLGNIGKASFTVDPEVTPGHHAPRRIAVTLHKEVKTKLEELEKKTS